MRTDLTSFVLAAMMLTGCVVRPAGDSSTDSETGTSAGTGGGSTGGSGDGTSTGAGGSTGDVEGSTGGSGPQTTTSTGTTLDPASTGGDNTGGAIAPATVENSCAPNDGPALEFHFALTASECGAAPESLDMRAFLYMPGPLPPGAYSLDGGNGHWVIQDGMNPPETGTQGTIIINSWDDTGASGHFELVQDGMGAFPGFFDMAPFCQTNPMCG